MAAQEVLNKIEEQLKCAICLSTYSDPRHLHCGHIFCRDCLVMLVVRDKDRKLSLPCPSCRYPTPIKGRGVSDIRPAFQVNNLVDIHDSIRKIRDSESSNVDDLEMEGRTLTSSRAWSCPLHVKKDMELYCETCGELICVKCTVVEHRGHKYDLIEEMFEANSENLKATMASLEGHISTIDGALLHFTQRREEIFDMEATVTQDITSAFRKLQEALEERKTELLGDLSKTVQEKQKRLSVQRRQVEVVRVKLRRSLDMMREGQDNGDYREMLAMKTTVEKQVEKLRTGLQPELLLPKNPEEIQFFIPANITLIKKYGELTLSHDQEPDASKCFASGTPLSRAMAEEVSTFILSDKNRSCKKPIRSLQCNLVSEITGCSVKGNVVKMGCGQYEMSYMPRSKGRHQLHVKVEGQNILGSPFVVKVKSPVGKLNNPFHTFSGVKGAWGVAINHRNHGEVIISKHFHHSISIFTPNGKKLCEFGGEGSGQGQFNRPCGVAVDGEGNIVVVDRDNHRIQKFTSKGVFLTATGTRGGGGTGPICFHYPTGIAYNARSNKFYIVDGNEVQVLNSDLTFSSTFQRKKSSKGPSSNQCDITCDSTGKVYLTDSERHRIKVFTAEGEFVHKFGKQGQGLGELDCPYGLAIDSEDNIYVSNRTTYGVSVFTTGGEFVTSFGQEYVPAEDVFIEMAGAIHFHLGLALDSDGVVYVSNLNSKKLKLF